MSSLIFRPHSLKQEQAIYSKKKFIVLGTGIQFGKTTVGAVFMRRLIHEYSSKEDAFILTAPSYKIMKQSTLPAFEKIMCGIGKYNAQDATYKIDNGPTIYCRTATQPDSIVGITNVRGIWGDEAGKYPLYFWENMQARASFKDCQIILTTSPYSLNWIYKELIRQTKKGLRNDVELIQARSDENPYFPPDEFERRKKTMDPRRFKMIYGGEWDRPEGLVYDCFDEEQNMCDPLQLPSDTIYYAGVDWGYRDPFVILIRGITLYGDQFEVSEFYKTGLRPSEIVDIMDQKQRVFNIKQFICDPSRPELIAECNSRRIRAVPADNSIQIGIDRYYELIKSRRYKIFRGVCPHLVDEIDSYHYAEEKDLKPDQNKSKTLEVPVDQSNHCLDCARYLSLGTHRSKEKYVPAVPDAKIEHKGFIKRGAI